MNAFIPLPPQFRWTSQELAGAVPLRLAELVDFDAARDGAIHAANGARVRLRIAHGYRTVDAMSPRFRIS